MSIQRGLQPMSGVTYRFVPRRGNQLAALLITDHRRAQTLFVIDEGVSEATLNAKELAVDAIDVAVARHRAHQFASARAKAELAAVRAERAGRDGLLKLPRASLMTIGRIKQRARRADFDAV